MGTHSSRPELKDRSFSSTSTPHFTASLCTARPSSVAQKKSNRTGAYNELWGSGSGTPHTTAPVSSQTSHQHHQHQHRRSSSDRDDFTTATKREAAEREQASNYFSNDYKRQLSLRKAAQRAEREQRVAQQQQQHSSSRSQESGVSSQLSKEDLSRLAEMQKEDPLSRGTRRSSSTAPSVKSETSVRTTAHKPILRATENKDAIPATHPRGKAVGANPPRRLTWSDEVTSSRSFNRREAAMGNGYVVPLFVMDPSASVGGGCDWSGSGGFGCCDGGGGGGCDNTCGM